MDYKCGCKTKKQGGAIVSQEYCCNHAPKYRAGRSTLFVGNVISGHFEPDCKATLSDIRAAAKEMGYAVVPINPHELMLEAGKEAHYYAEQEAQERFNALSFGLRANRAKHVYKAMIKAAEDEQ